MIAKRLISKEGRDIMICEKSYLNGRVKFQKIYVRYRDSFWRKHPSLKMVTKCKKIFELDKLYSDFI